MKTYGDLNVHLIGIVMKGVVERAISIIKRECLRFTFKEKATDYKSDKDYVTSADHAAQKIYVKLLRECFPTFGIIAEEDGLIIPCTENLFDAYFTIDPLDGTKAFMRRQSEGVGTMLGLIINGKVAASFIGDVMTEEIYCYRPESNKVHRILELGKFEPGEVLSINPEKKLSEQFVLLRKAPDSHSLFVQQLTKKQNKGGLFKGINVMAGSVGITTAKLWKSEIGAVIWTPGITTSWDLTPVFGISEKLGFEFYSIEYDLLSFPYITQKNFVLKERKIKLETETIIIHKSRVPELLKWIARNYK
ncbi:MAG: inositol monophosphatase family protein [Candidatus Paceibacterota bacterium]